MKMNFTVVSWLSCKYPNNIIFAKIMVLLRKALVD